MARVPVRMPKMSMTMTEGELSHWAIGVGDEIASGDVICEVLTDKVDMEVESPATGTLVEIVHDSGIVPVGEPIGWIEADGDSFTDLLDFGDTTEPAAAGDELGSDGADAPTPEPEPAPAPAPAGTASSGPVAAVPRARALAAEAGLDLRSITPTGPGGVVSIADVQGAVEAAAQPAAAPPAPARALTPPQRKRAAAQAQSAAAPAEPTPAPAAAPAAAPGVAQPPAPAPVAAAALAAGQVSAKVAAVRRAVARKMTESAAIPQFTVWRDLVLDTADEHRDGLSWTTVLLQSYARALLQVPRLLDRWDGENAVPTGGPVVALAVDTPEGLMVPTFTAPESQNPRRLDEDLRAVAKAARTGKVDGAHQGVANASLSNLGGFGVDRFQALITPPQGSVLALGSISRRPVAVPGGIGTALVVTAGLTVDHRVGDGADGARLLALMADDLA
ncbi:2-oxo acid dehydrogenase subunit E2 [Klenkia brasiliensis]|uniref:Dihydrolipoamide acetyltransferase component of pyruvate dehydrogenase complex n=1 Tax=Klenkia brasiliensis TaxID=333142 RepID=A0A1G7M5S2_9ACTN|nr:2-oxo acid dehydrogenase subunit E2 [Klenkia brasiliensis]SDF57107.1 pyruvate dehydrogenase E2 component (dihydrolipoamide acetyltransferase) [Klenkia brasiliensis]